MLLGNVESKLYNIFAVGGRGQVPSTMEERGEISRTCPHVREEERGGEGYWVTRMTWERGWWRMLLLCGATKYLPYCDSSAGTHPHACVAGGPPDA